MAKINGIAMKVNCLMYFLLNTVGGETKRVTTKCEQRSCYAITHGMQLFNKS